MYKTIHTTNIQIFMESIFKYQLETIDEQVIEMPLGAEVLTVQVQNEIPCIWAKVNPSNTSTSYRFRIFGTGQPIEEDFTGKYIGTYQLLNGLYVFHLFLV